MSHRKRFFCGCGICSVFCHLSQLFLNNICNLAACLGTFSSHHCKVRLETQQWYDNDCLVFSLVFSLSVPFTAQAEIKEHFISAPVNVSSRTDMFTLIVVIHVTQTALTGQCHYQQLSRTLGPPLKWIGLSEALSEQMPNLHQFEKYPAYTRPANQATAWSTHTRPQREKRPIQSDFSTLNFTQRMMPILQPLRSFQSGNKNSNFHSFCPLETTVQVLTSHITVHPCWSIHGRHWSDGAQICFGN